jgi:hypothetical protein
MIRCVKPFIHLVRLSDKSSRSTNQNAPFGRHSTTCKGLNHSLSIIYYRSKALPLCFFCLKVDGSGMAGSGWGAFLALARQTGLVGEVDVEGGAVDGRGV